MAHIELCFQCGNVDSSPKGLIENEWDWKEIKKLLEELEIPILKTSEEYVKLYRKKRSEREQHGAAKRVPPDGRSNVRQ